LHRQFGTLDHGRNFKTKLREIARMKGTTAKANEAT